MKSKLKLSDAGETKALEIDATSLEDYLGVQIVQSDDGVKAWLGRPTITLSLEKQFGERELQRRR